MGKTNGAWAIRHPCPVPRQRLEGQPYASCHVIRVVLIPLHETAVEVLALLQRRTSRQVVAGQVERRVGGEPPGESTVDLGTDVAGITLGEALAEPRNRPPASAAGVGAPGGLRGSGRVTSGVSV